MQKKLKEFVSNLDNFFDIAHAYARQLMKIEEDKMSLQLQREPGRPGHWGGVDKKTDQQRGKVADVVTLHSEGKLLPVLSARKSKEERLPIVISYGLKEQLIAVPRLDNSTGKEHTQAFWKAILDWNLKDNVPILCCDTKASNTGRFNDACALLEQTFCREMLFFACRHHVYELVLKAVFEVKIKETTSPDIPLFKKIKDNWKDIDLTKIQCYRETIELFLSVPELENLFDFYRAEFKNVMVRDDYRELIELCIVFLGRNA
ncbi:hypothetical protein AVEN_219148-1 [Araneus ventricosus]|uniref:Uncharacterized protein n=1 Tax=Araneus ventricosus TaxID=182803 RepID=A0A4Y2FQD3_ARAVE|nr:hypothetical protein AVEN_219148-1 [Araneus ventricosus]